MENLEKYLIGVADNIDNLKYEQVILGQDVHPRKTDVKKYPPDPLFGFAENVPFFKIDCYVKGKSVVVIGDNAYIPEPGDIDVIPREAKNYETYLKKYMAYELVVMFLTKPDLLKVLHTAYTETGELKIISAISMNIKQKDNACIDDIFTIKEPEKQFISIKAIIKKWFGCVKENLQSKSYIKRVFTEKSLLDKNFKAKRIENATKYIKVHYKEKITLKDIAEQVRLNPSYFSSLFSEIFDFSVFEFIRGLRIKDACALLRTTHLSVKEISEMVGYEATTLFIQNFKKNIGLTPSKYRQRFVKANSKFLPRL